MKYQFSIRIHDKLIPMLSAHDDMPTVTDDVGLHISIEWDDGDIVRRETIPAEYLNLLRTALNMASRYPQFAHLFAAKDNIREREIDKFTRAITERADLSVIVPATELAASIFADAAALEERVRQYRDTGGGTSYALISEMCHAIATRAAELYLIGDLLGNAD